MKSRILASLILASLTGSAFALPGIEQPPLTEWQHDQRQAPILDVSRAAEQPFATPAARADQHLAKGQKLGKRKRGA